ncbi:hypothetical protein Tco_0888593 [Tanacetum coccineum]
MSWFSRCSWCGGPFNGGNYWRCTNWCGDGLREGFSLFCASRDGNSSINAPNPNSFNDPLNVFTHPLQLQYESYSCELCGNNAHYGYDCPPWVSLFSIDHQPQSIQEDLNQQRMNDVLKAVKSLVEKLCQLEQAANLSTNTPEPSRHFNSICYDDEESTIPLNEVISQIPPSNSSVEDLVPIPSESKDTSGSDSECDLPSCDDFSPINIPEGNSVTFFYLLFNDNDAFTSSDDESLPEEDVPKENYKIYSNPLFEFNDEYISSDLNPLFNEVLEDIESEDSYVSKLDEPDLLVTPLSKLNEDECFDPGGNFVLEEIEACPTSDSISPRIYDDDFDPEGDILLLEKLLNDDPLSPLPTKELNYEELKVIKLKVIKSDVSSDFEDDYYDSEGDIIYLESLVIKDTTHILPPEVFLDHDPRSLEDEPDKDDLKNIVEVFDPEIHKKITFPTNVRFTFEDRHYFSIIFVIRIFLLYFTYPVDSSLHLSSWSEDIIFDPDISAYSFYSLERCDVRRLASFLSRVSWLVFYVQDCPDCEDSRARGFVHRLLDLQSLSMLIFGNPIS